MSNTNCKNIENSDYCNYCNYCNSSYSCYSCNFCDFCNSCNSCNYCNSSYSCYSCNFCDFCNSCYFCYFCDSCNYSYGLRMSEKMIFCLGDGRSVSSGPGYQKNLQIFNTPVSEEEWSKTRNALAVKSFKLPIAKWVETKDMTDSEKSNWSSHKQTGGFLKTLSYHDAWKELWDGLSQEDKNFLTTLPHFNADIFEKITGIKIDDKKSELLKKADELVQKANELKAEAEKM